MVVFNKSAVGTCFCIVLAMSGMTRAAGEGDIPEPLKPWTEWVTWGEAHPDCPTPYNDAGAHICFWPSRLSLAAGPTQGSWSIEVTVYEQTWVPLPGSDAVWPFNVRAGEEPLPVIPMDGIPSVRLPPGVHQLTGEFQWGAMPQRIAVPKQVGILSLVVDDAPIPLANWDENGDVWLKRVRAEAADKDLLAAQVYRVIEDGIPLWLHTDVELTVSGKSREEELGSILPEGWQLSYVESPLPAAVDDQGGMKVQVRAGKWTIGLHAFRAADAREIRYPAAANPVANVELVGFRAKPEFRIAEIEGIPAVDVTQTTFPDKWRNLPVYQWQTTDAIQLIERMRGMGQKRPEGLEMSRQFWLDEGGQGFTYRDTIQGHMQQIWRLDVDAGHQLGAVRVDGEGQLITANPATGAHGVEIRDRNLNLEAVGRIPRTNDLTATGWQADAESLQLTMELPPGWRVFAIFGADRVQGDWLTAWSLLDLFLLLVFSIAVFRMWGVAAGLVAFLAFGLAYHEPAAPRLTWLFLLMPLALLRVVQEGTGKRWVEAWKYLAMALLLLNLIPFVVSQVQSAIYPQLEPHGMQYTPRGMLGLLGRAYEHGTMVADAVHESGAEERARSSLGRADIQAANLFYDPNARIQTGPAQPRWTWNRVRCDWRSPVSAGQEIRLVLIPQTWQRVLTVMRIVLLMWLAAILLRSTKIRLPFAKRQLGAAVTLATLLTPATLLAQFPEQVMLDTLRERLLDPSDAYPHAAEIPAVTLKIDGNKIEMETEIHAVLDVAVPLPGRLPAWSPLSITINDDPNAVVYRHDGYLWLSAPSGTHRVVVEGLLPDVTEWEWTFLLKPRRVTIDAGGWNVTGVNPDGKPEPQVFFTRKRESSAAEAAYDQKNFQAIVVVERNLEVGLVWKVRNVVTRLSPPGKAVSLQLPLLAGESVLTAGAQVVGDFIDVRLGANQATFQWHSELPIREQLRLEAAQTEVWVERWHLVISPVWNVALTGLAPTFESQQENLVPTWHPWPGENVVLAFSRPQAVEGDTITVQHVRHEVSLGARQRHTDLSLGVECSIGSDFAISLDSGAAISALSVDDQTIPVRREGAQLIVPVRPGEQTIKASWKSTEAMSRVVSAGQVLLPVEGSNVTTVISVPESRWVLWADGPLRGPAIRFWTVLVCAVLAAIVLGSLPLSPLTSWEWVLLGIGLTQIHVSAALLVVAWLFWLSWRGRQDVEQLSTWRFNLLQLALVLLTLMALGIFIVVVGEGLLGSPEMFIRGNGSSQTYLQWFEPRVQQSLPEPYIVSISVWYYRLLMLFWALWLAAALLRWLKWGWSQFSKGRSWKPVFQRHQVAAAANGDS